MVQDLLLMGYDAALRGKRIPTLDRRLPHHHSPAEQNTRTKKRVGDAGGHTLIPSTVRCCSFQLNVRSSLIDLFLIMMEQHMLCSKTIAGQRRTFYVGAGLRIIYHRSKPQKHDKYALKSISSTYV